MTNSTILIDAENLHRPLTTIQARFACSFCARLIKVPQSVYDLFIRIFRAGTDAYFDCPCSQDANGDWKCYIIGTCFRSAKRTTRYTEPTKAETRLPSVAVGSSLTRFR